MQKKIIDRDLSWLSFNERVLQEAENNNVPLYERLKFLAIFSSNLDEFYRVRVSELRQFKRYQKDTKKKLFEKPKRLIKRIQKKVSAHQERFGAIFFADIIPSLKQENIYLIEKNEFSIEQKQFSLNYFKTQVQQHIKVYNLETDIEPVFLEDKGLFLFLKHDSNLLINIPTNKLPRFITFPTQDGKFYVTYIDEIIKDNLTVLNPNYKNLKSYCIKITRDAELYFNEYDGEVVELIKEHISQRKTGIPTRMLYDSTMPKDCVKSLRKQLDLNKTDLMPGGKFHNFSDFFGFPTPKHNPKLFYKPQEPSTHPELEHAKSIINHVKYQDVLLSYPYQKFDYIPKLILEAAKSNRVHTINISLYRVSKDSEVAKALLVCLEHGKKVTVFIEAKARFDEANNIFWGDLLKKHGAQVLYSIPKIKVHSKIFLIEGDNFNVGYIGTGNFNEKSAKIYTDFGLLTSNNNITTDLKQVFKFLVNPDQFKPHLKAIWMSPFNTRRSITDKIDREIKFAKANKPASLTFKMNSLEDEAIINKLYEASQAGVEVKLIVRGIFRLKPELEGLSKNIKAVSIVGRYLEHARVYLFENNGNEELFIASADCMTRNLDKRVEVATPITNEKLKAVLKRCLDWQWRDNTKARILDAEQKNEYQKNRFEPINAQNDFYELLKQ
ncbi:polyphosphate kinase 1 [Postechiella marina]|uniref:Polyphosphate kinase n=1 Tax=Postechiella marina TaxID=943941 RepID=A0ABP8C843_9FLAO